MILLVGSYLHWPVFAGSEPEFYQICFTTIQEGDDSYNITVTLKDSAGNAIGTPWTVSSTSPSVSGWFEESYTFSGYGPGLRSIHFKDGGYDSEFWNNHYGIRMDDAYVIIQSD